MILRVMKISDNKIIYIAMLLTVAAILRFFILDFLEEDYSAWVRFLAVAIIIGVGAAFVLRGCANIIEETTEVLSERTKFASGLLQSLGTAFPDMVLGIVAAVVSVKMASTNYALAINFAIIAAATTFGSNIYNIGHAAWAIFRQNMANAKSRSLLMFPFIKAGGTVKPMYEHSVKPTLSELDTSIDILTILTVLTGVVALSMVIFGHVNNAPSSVGGDMYQLIRPVGLVVFVLCIGVLYYFRKTKREDYLVEDIAREERYYREKSNNVIVLHLLFSGIAILFAAESMIHAIEVFSALSGMPFVVAGVLAGVIGCLGEMIVVHNFTVDPRGRIGDAVVGVGMDNIVTTLGASIVAVMGGIFLGGNALILIFVIILTLNTVLIWQVSRLKNYFLLEGAQSLK